MRLGGRMELCEEERKTHLGGVESQTGGGVERQSF